MSTIARFAPLALLAVFAAHAATPRATTCTPIVRDAWVRMTPTMPMGAAYFVLENPCRTATAVVSARSVDFDDVSMHETRIENGMSRMRPLPRVELAPGARVTFAPGGRHVMLMSPTRTPTSSVKLDLQLADGRHLAVDAPLRSAAP